MKHSNRMTWCSSTHLTVYKQKMAYYEAGFLTAMYFNCFNNPRFYFPHAGLEDIEHTFVSNSTIYWHDYLAKMEEERFLDASFQIDEHGIDYSGKQSTTEDDRAVLEVGIINLLIGVMAEAKYCHQMDNETLSPQLLNTQ